MDKCNWGDGVTIKPDGENELDPCIYEDIARYTNVTITISRCLKCGHIEIAWEKQDTTEELPIEA